jgi:hypothetical protein
MIFIRTMSEPVPIDVDAPALTISAVVLCVGKFNPCAVVCRPIKLDG